MRKSKEDIPEAALDSDGKLPRQIHWISANKRYAVVSGPFPYSFVRSIDAASIEEAARRDPNTLESRPGTTKGDRFAKVRVRDIAETHNEFGEIAP